MLFLRLDSGHGWCMCDVICYAMLFTCGWLIWMVKIGGGWKNSLALRSFPSFGSCRTSRFVSASCFGRWVCSLARMGWVFCVQTPCRSLGLHCCVFSATEIVIAVRNSSRACGWCNKVSEELEISLRESAWKRVQGCVQNHNWGGWKIRFPDSWSIWKSRLPR